MRRVETSETVETVDGVRVRVRVSDADAIMAHRMSAPVLSAADVRPGPAEGLFGHRHAWLLGIGGVGLGAAAELLLARGLKVGGSERCPAPRTRRLEGLGVHVDHAEDGDGLPPDVDLVVASAAIPATHPQLVEARRRGLTVWKYADLLGALMADRFALCIAGTHGKTTTTALVASALVHAGRDPSFVVGGDLQAFGTGARSGRGSHFVAEACEYDRSFLQYRPRIGVITNVDEDHLDYYRDLAEIEEAFGAFAALVPPDGLVLAYEPYVEIFREDPRVVAPVASYGFSAGADWRIEEVGGSRFRLHRGERLAGSDSGSCSGSFEAPLVGRHNVLNAAAAAVTSMGAGLSAEEAADGLAAFGGVGRRLEVIARRGGILVLDDYAHHPVEVEATLGALRQAYRGRRLVVVFQPHQASRTRRLLDAFARALAGADEVWIPPIYFARDSEEARRGVSSQDLARRVREVGGRALALPDLAATVLHAAAQVRAGDVVVTMGAGDVDEVARGLADRLP